jgi:hypothetical protein
VNQIRPIYDSDLLFWHSKFQDEAATDYALTAKIPLADYRISLVSGQDRCFEFEGEGKQIAQRLL